MWIETLSYCITGTNHISLHTADFNKDFFTHYINCAGFFIEKIMALCISHRCVLLIVEIPMESNCDSHFD